MQISKKQMKMMPILFCALYMVSYMTRINYGAIISEMQRATNYSKQMLSMALTGAFITYGAGQIVTGALADRFSPKRLVLYGMGLTVGMNLLIPLCKSPWQMLIVWCINGFAQAFMWPPIAKLLIVLMDAEEYKKGIVTVSCGGSYGTIAIYLLAPVILSIGGWKAVFIFCACCGICMMFIWQRFCLDVDIKTTNRRNEKKTIAVKKSDDEKKESRGVSSYILAGVLVAIVCNGMLRDGVTTWMPSFISETYNMSNIAAILSGVLLPLFGIACYKISQHLYSKKFSNPIQCAAVIFTLSTVASIMLYVAQNVNAVLAMLLLALLNGCMHGVNLMLVGILPLYFAGTNRVGIVSGIMNAAVYIGSAISAYGVASVTELYGWGSTILIWSLAALIGTALCFGMAFIWKHHRTKESKTI